MIMEKKYTTLLFDADMTLFDFERAEEDAFGIVMQAHCISFDRADFERYKKYNESLWASYGRGEITKEFLQRERFAAFLPTVKGGEGLDGGEVNREYLESLADCSVLLDGAEDACRTLSSVYDLYIVTNGVERTQKKRLANSSIRQYIKDIFVSEEVGVPKPMKEYFDYVFAHIGEERRGSSVIIGDSLTSDTEGGRRAGIDTILFCPSGKPAKESPVPDHVVRDHAELVRLLTPEGRQCGRGIDD